MLMQRNAYSLVVLLKLIILLTILRVQSIPYMFQICSSNQMTV